MAVLEFDSSLPHEIVHVSVIIKLKVNTTHLLNQDNWS